MSRLGFIGLGTMGTPMAMNLLRAGHQLRVFARRPDAMAAVVALGATPSASPAMVAADSDVVFIAVTDSAAVQAVVLGDHGIIEGAHDGLIVVDHSTISPTVTRELSARLKQAGVSLLDAPVSGGSLAASSGALSIMVGGDADAFERSRPILSALGKTVTYMGPSGAGQLTKICNQICVVVNQLGVAEALLVAERSGLDVARVTNALMAGFGASRMFELQAPKMASRDFRGAVESRLHDKDIRIALALASELGITLPTSSLAASILGKLQERGGGRLDSAAVYTILEEGFEP